MWQKKFSHYLDVKRNMSRNNPCRILTFLIRPFQMSRRQRQKRSINWSAIQRLISIPFALRCRKAMHLELLILFSLYPVQLYTTSNWMTFHVKVALCSSDDKCRNCVGRSELLLTQESLATVNTQIKRTTQTHRFCYISMYFGISTK